MELKVICSTGSDITIRRTEYTVQVSPFDTGIRGTQTSLFTAKGQLLVAAGAGQPSVLNAGSPGQSLTPDPSAPTGLAWVAGSGSSVSTLTNMAGIQLNPGDVVIRHSSSRCVTTTTVVGSLAVMGVVQEAIANGASGAVATFAGHIVRVNCASGIVNIGDYLRTSATATKASATRARVSGSFAVALSYKGVSVGQVYAMLLPMDPVLALPTDYANLAGWYRSESLAAYGEGAMVGQWDDSSGGGYHLTQTTDAYKPLCRKAALAGRDVAQFDGANDVLMYNNHPMLDGNTAKTLFVVGMSTGEDSGMFGKSNTTALSSCFMLETKGYTPSGYVNSSIINGTVTDYSSYFIGALTSDGSTIQRLYRNGQLLNTRSGDHASVSGRLSMGYRYNSTPFYWAGYIAEAIAWQRELTSSELAAMFGYLSAKYSITLA